MEDVFRQLQNGLNADFRNKKAGDSHDKLIAHEQACQTALSVFLYGILDAGFLWADAWNGADLPENQELWKSTDNHDTDTVTWNILCCFHGICSCILDSESASLPGICVWRNCTCNSSGSGTVDCTGVPYTWAGDRHTAADGGS